VAEPFPQLEAGNPVEEAVSPPNLLHAVPQELGALSAHMEGVGNVLGQMAAKAAGAEGQEAATRDVAAGAVNPANPVTEYGATYNSVAKQGLDAQRKAALVGAMGQAFAANPDDPAGLDKALTAVKAGFAPTPYGEVNQSFDNEFALQHADLMNKAQLGLRRTMTETQAAAFQTDFATASGTLEQIVSGASFDAAGAAKVTAAIGNFAQTFAKYGPAAAYTINGQEIPADANRTGWVSPVDINSHVLAAVWHAKGTWAKSAQLSLPDAASQAKFADDLREGYASGDPKFAPLFAGMTGEQAQGIFTATDAQAGKAGQDEKVEQNTHAQAAEQALEAYQWGHAVDWHTAEADAQASGRADLVAKVKAFETVPEQTRGVLKTVLARSLGLIPEPGAKGIAPVALDANGNPVAQPAAPISAPLPGQDAVADQVRGVAAGAGATPAEANTLVKIAQLESSLDPSKNNGQSQGLFQFRPGTWGRMGGGDITSVRDQTVNALSLLRSNTAVLTQSLGRPPTEGELYLAHQQGVAGAQALLANPGATAVSALTPLYEHQHPGQGAQIATQAIVNNGGQPGMSAGAFAAKWTGRLDGAGGAASAVVPDVPAGIHAAPPGLRPGTPAFLAWGSTMPGFAADPIKFAAGDNSTRLPLATVPPMIPQAAFAQDPGQVAGWTKAMQGRFALAGNMQKVYFVPFRMFTDAERDGYKSYLQQQPAAIVTLASRLTTALGPAGASAALREIGADGDVNVPIHIGQLQAWGLPNIAARAADGLALKAAGARDPREAPGLTSYTSQLDAAQRAFGTAFRNDPGVIASARQVADLARLSDSQKGVENPPEFYLQSSLGMSVDGQGHNWGGVAKVNGAQTLLPYWLRQDQAEPALSVLGRNMPVSHMPLYTNGQPMSASEFAKMQIVARPGGLYGLVFRDTQKLALTAGGRPFLLDLNAVRAFISSHLPGAVRR
jgi:hypothetical protein